MNIFFWNLHSKDNTSLILQALFDHNVDLAFFSEYGQTDFKEIEKSSGHLYHWNDGNGGCDKVTCLLKRNYAVAMMQESSRYTIYQFYKYPVNIKIEEDSYNFDSDVKNISIEMPEANEDEFIVACVHLPDKRNYPKMYARYNPLQHMVSQIMEIEKNRYWYKSIVIGDFNTEPYDDEMFLNDSMNSVLFRREMVPETVKSDGRNFRKFYNPILECLSEENNQLGSYRLNKAPGPIWHCLDQILFRKSLMDSFDHMEYLRMIGQTSLMKQMNPDNRYSDHLPLLAVFK